MGCALDLLAHERQSPAAGCAAMKALGQQLRVEQLGAFREIFHGWLLYAVFLHSAYSGWLTNDIGFRRSGKEARGVVFGFGVSL